MRPCCSSYEIDAPHPIVVDDDAGHGIGKGCPLAARGLPGQDDRPAPLAAPVGIPPLAVNEDDLLAVDDTYVLHVPDGNEDAVDLATG